MNKKNDPDAVVRITKEELDRLQSENERFRNALDMIYDECRAIDYGAWIIASEALKGGEE